MNTLLFNDKLYNLTVTHVTLDDIKLISADVFTGKAFDVSVEVVINYEGRDLQIDLQCDCNFTATIDEDANMQLNASVDDVDNISFVDYDMSLLNVTDYDYSVLNNIYSINDLSDYLADEHNEIVNSITSQLNRIVFTQLAD